ncbi:MAG: type IV secretion system DNA-binding domain-containing protein [Acidimicrobiaceae bacterium]|nr:type IV secretion system DNA-binding domain-containing protein [Acidimicrobiaceae bacterium]
MWDDALSYIGERDVWGGQKLFGISPDARAQHLFIIGQTGTGKSTLIRNLIIQDIEKGHGVGLIDPHGDLAEDILDCIPPQRTDHVAYLNPADHEFPVGFNVLRPGTNHAPHLIASAIVGALKSIWRDSWGPRMEYILYTSIAALLECENVTILGVQRMLIDPIYRTWVIRQVRDPMVRAFWTGEFAGYDRRFLTEVIAPVQNKIGQLVMAPPIRHILGQVRSSIDIRFLMDRSRILIANLAKGKVGEDKANLLGSLLVTQFQLAALSRADIPPAQRNPFHLYVDEYHNFATDSFASILSEARKYGLSLTLAAQYTSQTRPEITNAVFGNVGTIMSFRVGEADATLLARQFGEDIQPATFTSLGNHHVVVKPLTNEGYAAPFRATTLRPIMIRSGRRNIVIARSHERFSTKREVIESRIRRWMGEPTLHVARKHTPRATTNHKKKGRH